MAFAQRTAIKQRPHQQTMRSQVAKTEPVVFHHGREESGHGGGELRPSASIACWGAHRPSRGDNGLVADFVHPSCILKFNLERKLE